MLVYGDAFWPTYTTGDNTGLIATDSMKNFIQRETMNFAGDDLEDYCRFLATKFLAKYPQVEGIQVSAVEIPYAATRAAVGVRARRAGAGDGARSSSAQAASSRCVGHPRLQAAAPRRQRVPGLRARRVHDAAGSARIGRCTCGSTSNGRTPARTTAFTDGA